MNNRLLYIIFPKELGIGGRLKKYREKESRSIDEVSRYLSIRFNQYQLIENNESDISFTLLNNVCAFLKIDSSEIVFEAIQSASLYYTAETSINELSNFLVPLEKFLSLHMMKIKVISRELDALGKNRVFSYHQKKKNYVRDKKTHAQNV